VQNPRLDESIGQALVAGWKLCAGLDRSHDPHATVAEGEQAER
jgi:hypothetical protein